MSSTIPTTPGTPPTGNTTVLVIEDDREINELLGEYLALENIGYASAETGQGGIHTALRQHPDAIILDLMLPDIDGFEVARTISTKRATYDIPIVILSCMCQDCDKEKGYGAGALYYMNKPFLPDDLLSTLREALTWKETLKTRTPSGRVALGEKDCEIRLKAINEMIADVFTGTDLSDASVAAIRETVDTLHTWAKTWNHEHTDHGTLFLDYQVVPAATVAGADKGTGTVEWTLSESESGLLADAFFKPVPTPSTGVLGWGAASLMTKPLAPIAPPSKWLQVLAKSGAAKFEKDSKRHLVRFTRGWSATNGITGEAVKNSPSVPVVEIDGLRYPTRLRDEALAAKRR